MRAHKSHCLFCTCVFNAGVAISHACHSGVRDFLEFRVYSRVALGLVKLDFYFGRVVMGFLEVTCVRASLAHCFAHVALAQVGLTLAHATTASVISRSCASLPELPWVY